MEGLRWILLLVGLFLIAAVYWSGRRREDPTRESLFERAQRAAERDERDQRTSAPTGADAPELDVGAGRPGEPPGADEPGDSDIGVAEPEPEPEPETEPGPGPEARAAPEGVTGAMPDQEGPTPEAGPPRSGDAPQAPRAEAQSSKPASVEPQRGETDQGRTKPSGTAGEPMVVLFLVATEGERLVGARLAEVFARHGLEHGEQNIFHARDGDEAIVFSVANAVEPGTFDPATMDTLSTPGLVMVLRLPGPQWAETAFDRMVSTARRLADELGARVLDGNRSTLTRQTEQHLREDLRAFDLRRSRGHL